MKRLRALSAVFISAITCLVLTSPAGHEARAQGHLPARMQAMGGEAVSGIIPDLFTDIVLNPAYLVFSDNTTVNYGYRVVASQNLPFPSIDYSYTLQPKVFEDRGTNEITILGIRTGEWNWGAVAEWRIYRLDSTDPEYLRYSNRENYRTRCRNTENDYWRFEIAGAHPLGSAASAGLRFGMSSRYADYLYRYKYITQWYKYSDILGTEIIDNYDSSDQFDSYEKRLRSTYLEIGLLSGRDPGTASGITLKVSYSSVFYREHNYDLDIDENYDSRGELDRYRYYLEEWRDKRGGDLWAFGLTGRYSLPEEIRSHVGMTFNTCSYDTDWYRINRDYVWQDGTAYMTDLGTSLGDGDYKKFSIFAKIGRTFGVGKTIDLTAGIYSYFHHYWFEENPELSASSIVLTDAGRQETDEHGRAAFESEHTRARLRLPLAVEFRPGGYVTLFGGFQASLDWDRNSNSYSIPDLIMSPARCGRTAGGTGGAHASAASAFDEPDFGYTNDEVSSSYSATIGFSLHYKEKFFFDCYTGSDLTPDNLTSYILDVRYIF